MVQFVQVVSIVIWVEFLALIFLFFIGGKKK